MTDNNNSDAVLPIQEDVSGDVSGSMEIHDSVLVSIIRKAVSDIPGFSRLAGGGFIDNLAEIVGTRKTSFDKAISIDVQPDGVSFGIRIVACFGCFVPEVAAKVREAVFSSITDSTGMTVKRVDVYIVDMEEKPADENGADEGADIQ